MGDQHVETGTRTFQATSALARGLRVKLTASKLVVAGAGDVDAVGVIDTAALAADELVPVRLPTAEGTVVMRAHDAFSAYAPLYAAAAGRVDDSGLIPVGIAMQAATTQDDLIEVLPTTSVLGGAVGNEVWISPDGSDDASGTILAPLATLTAAMAAVTATRAMIRAFPGTYTEAATVVWRIIDGVHITLSGEGPIGSVVIGTASGDEVISIAPGATATSTFEFTIDNIMVDHDEAGLDGIVIDNTSTTNKINGYIKDLSLEADSDADRSVLVTHGNLSDAVRLYWVRGEIGGLIEYSANNNGDRLHLTDGMLDGGLTVGATAVATDYKFKYCRIKHGGIDGGHASTVVQLLFCYTNESGTLALADTSDVGGSITGEVIVGS